MTPILLTGLAAFLGSVSVHVLEHAQCLDLIGPPKPTLHAGPAQVHGRQVSLGCDLREAWP
jgi:hypothetical protein